MTVLVWLVLFSVWDRRK